MSSINESHENRPSEIYTLLCGREGGGLSMKLSPDSLHVCRAISVKFSARVL